MSIIERLSDDPRVTVRRPGPPDPDGRCVLYWMQRAQRFSDNTALDVAIDVANELRKPVVCYFGLVSSFPGANLRHFTFLAEGLPDIVAGLARRRVSFILRRGRDHGVERLCEELKPALVVCDENPLREPERWRKRLTERVRIPFWTVDADVVVPSVLLEKEQYGARTIRPRIHRQLEWFLVRPKEHAARVRWKAPSRLEALDPGSNLLDGLAIDRTVGPVASFRGGPTEGHRLLRRFLAERLEGYDENRNHPETDGTSQLSPYLHFGHLGPRGVALAVRDAAAPLADRQAFLEQFIVRRELSVNFVRFNPRYDSLAGCEPWALDTLRRHHRDRRPYLYSARQLERAETHDQLWNAAQRQMVKSGWMHGYVRMYWAKKILEWTRSPEEAFAIALELNDRYELDGRDPNGYTGIAWAIGGKHDRAWGPERPVFGMIRYMSYGSTSRKFDYRQYVDRQSS
jgi:deoxyribodipyrimidine photo-lyase